METKNNVDAHFQIDTIPLVYATTGVVIDFAKQQYAVQDADITAEAIGSLFVYDSPVTVLEQTLTITGAAQTLVINAPVLGDANICDATRIVAVDLGIQLNNQTIPKTDINFDLQFLDGTGTVLAPRTQTITGNAAVTSGDTRQYIRMLNFEQNATLPASGVTSAQDGKIISLPRFQRPNAAHLTTLAAAVGLTTAELRTVFPGLAQDVGSVVVNIPAGAFAVGVVLTATVVTVGRMPAIGEMMSSLDTVGNAGASSAADAGSEGLISRLFAR